MAYVFQPHGRTRPSWRTNENRPKGKLIGVELEIENPNGQKYTLDAIPEPENEESRPITESDGSLDHTGVEIVFAPIPYADLYSETSFFGKTLLALDDAGAVGSQRCGMHLNVNTEDWTSVKKCSFLAFLHWIPEAAISHLGGRVRGHYYPQNPHLSYDGMLRHTEHVTCAGIRPNRIEVRFPKATTNLRTLQVLVNFIEYLEEWCELENTRPFLENLSSSNAHVKRGLEVLQKFIKFLRTKNTPIAAKIESIFLHGYR